MEEKRQVNPISEEEFNTQIHQAAINNMEQVYKDLEQGILHLRDYSGVAKFKSIRRAIKRGHVSIFGDIYPNRPFSNAKSKKGNPTYERRKVYEQLKRNSSTY